MAHTPGPWTPCDASAVNTTDGVMVTPNHVKRVFMVGKQRHTQFICDCNTVLPESAANARLIAAAPDLLVALKEAAQTARNYAMLFHDVEWQARVDRWDAAIAKAEGR